MLTLLGLFLLESLLIYSLFATILDGMQMLFMIVLLAGMAMVLSKFIVSTSPVSVVSTKTVATETKQPSPPLPESMYRRKPKLEEPPPPSPPTEAHIPIDFSDCF